MSRLNQAQHGADSSPNEHVEDVSWSGRMWTAASTIKPVQDFKRLAAIPCARQSLLFGIATAVGVTGISLVAGRGVRRGVNWGVGSFCFISLASFQSCRSTYKAEQHRMKTVIEGYKRSSRAGKPSVTSLAEQEHQQAAPPSST